MRSFATNHKTALGLTNNFNLILVVWQTISRASSSILTQTFGSICVIVLCGVGLHLIYLLVNITLLAAFRFRIKEHKACLLMCRCEDAGRGAVACAYVRGHHVCVHAPLRVTQGP